MATESWQLIDTDNMSTACDKAYKGYKEAYEDMIVQREILEDALTKKLSRECPRGMSPQFSYKWGKLSFIYATPKRQASKKNYVTV